MIHPHDGLRFQRALKRLLDVVCSGAVLVLGSPLYGAVSVSIWATMGRPVLFRQRRPGFRERPFLLYKFRTMRPPGSEKGREWFRTDEERLTRFGRFLRRTSLDELPTFINVLKGELSLVGPRPLLMEYLDKYTPDQSRRHAVPPGITGLAQVSGRQAIPFSRRLELDLWYVDHWTLALDLRLLGETLASVFARRGVIPGQNVDDIDDLGFSRSGPKTYDAGGQKT